MRANETGDRVSLPRFDEVRRRAHRLLGDAADELRSDVRDDLTMRQATAVRRAFDAIAAAKGALDDAARRTAEDPT